jgi:hypothetical protein
VVSRVWEGRHRARAYQNGAQWPNPRRTMACKRRLPASARASLPLPAAPMQHGVRQLASHHAAPSHAAISAASAVG